MDIFAEFTKHIDSLLAAIDSRDASDSGVLQISVETPRDPMHGDLATNAALVAAKKFGRPPREIAEDVAASLREMEDIIKVDIAGPGFINWTFSNTFWQKTLSRILAAGVEYGQQPQGEISPENTINIEYVSANPTGPLHVAHARGAVFGDALSNLLKAAGHHIVREYYINDAGAQIDILARSAYLRYREALGEKIGEIPSGLYPGDYLKPVGQWLASIYQDALLKKEESEWLPLLRELVPQQMMIRIREDLLGLGISQDIFFSELSLTKSTDRIREAIETLRAQGVVYEGVLPPPKGAIDEDWEEREQTLFRATQFGDDVDRPLMKSDGSYTYFAADIAYHYVKFKRGAGQMINVWGADHGGYVKRMQAGVKAITRGLGSLDVRIIQLVRLLRSGEPLKMSKRSGDFVTLQEVLKEVGRDSVRFMMLMRKNDAPLDFDLAKVVEQSKDNPVFYVQYAHARIHSVYRQAQQAFPNLDRSNKESLDFTSIADPAEIELIKLLAFYPRLLSTAAALKEPHRLAFYLYDLASGFHSLWNKGKDLPHLRFINPDNAAWTRSHMALLRALETVLASGLSILGVSAPQEMR